MFNIFRNKKAEGAESTHKLRVEARAKFQALPIELSTPKVDRVAQRLLRIYQSRLSQSSKDISIKVYESKLKGLGVIDVPKNKIEAQVLVNKIKQDRQEK